MNRWDLFLHQRDYMWEQLLGTLSLRDWHIQSTCESTSTIMWGFFFGNAEFESQKRGKFMMHMCTSRWDLTLGVRRSISFVTPNTNTNPPPPSMYYKVRTYSSRLKPINRWVLLQPLRRRRGCLVWFHGHRGDKLLMFNHARTKLTSRCEHNVISVLPSLLCCLPPGERSNHQVFLLAFFLPSFFLISSSDPQPGEKFLLCSWHEQVELMIMFKNIIVDEKQCNDSAGCTWKIRICRGGSVQNDWTCRSWTTSPQRA